jgi:hypothetical protein
MKQTAITRRPSTDTAPDFTHAHCIAARRRVAGMLAAGLPLPTVAALFGLPDLAAGPFTRIPTERDP